MDRLRVLITNLSFTSRSGTETYTRDLALELKRRGHDVNIYAPLIGDFAGELEAEGVPVHAVLDDRVAAPDVIHGHHHVETVTALCRFPGVPAIFVCHDQQAWHDRPPFFPRLRRYVAVDEACRDRMLKDGVTAPVQTLGNAVDVGRFATRAPLPSQPRRALLFSHYASEFTFVPTVRAACVRAGLDLDIVGMSSGNLCTGPEETLPHYDIVFAKARCALEAMAVGCAVILCDAWGVGPMVRSDNWERLRPLNFGRRACSGWLTVEELLGAIAQYDPQDATLVCQRTRQDAAVPALADALTELYRTVIAEQTAERPVDPQDERRALAQYLHGHFAYGLVNRLAGVEAEMLHWKESAEQAHRQMAELQEIHSRHIRDLTEASARERDGLAQEREALAHQREALSRPQAGRWTRGLRWCKRVLWNRAGASFARFL